MKYRCLGRTGLRVSEIGFGAWGIGGGWGTRDDQTAHLAIRRARELGVNFFDTARVYGDGHSESLLGQALGREREDVIIASKVPPKTYAWPVTDDVPIHEAFPSEWIIQCTEKSLIALGTDYLDIQQLHAWTDAYVEQPEWLEAMERLREKGKVRFFGISANDWDPFSPQRLVESGKIDTLQVIYNLFEQRPADKLLPAAEAAEVGVIARVPFEEGLLTGKIRPGHAFDPDDWRKGWATEARLGEVQARLDAIAEACDENHRTLPELALAFIIAHPAVGSVIPGMRRPEHVAANCEVSDRDPLTAQQHRDLERHRFIHGWAYPWSKA